MLLYLSRSLQLPYEESVSRWPEAHIAVKTICIVYGVDLYLTTQMGAGGEVRLGLVTTKLF